MPSTVNAQYRSTITTV